MLGKIVLWVSTITFISYGLMCLVSPSVPAGYAGLEMISGDGYAEIGAMYGGLQIGFGVFCLLGALRSDLHKAALTSLVVVVGGLAIGRLYSTLTGTEQIGTYTYGAMVFEFLTATLAAVALRKA